MSISTPTLRDYLIGDLAPARRHCLRILSGVLPPSPAVVEEIARSIERCVDRISRDVPVDKPYDPA